MSKLYIYIVSSAPEPEQITCAVPYEIDLKEIFFGPCKKRLRSELRQQYLSPKRHSAILKENIYLVGLNGGNKRRIRNIIWAGKIKRIMTFAYAFQKLTAKRYKKMRSWDKSPLHVKPIYRKNTLIGYQHISTMHEEKNSWITDVIPRFPSKDIQVKGKNLTVENNLNIWKAFSKDCCFTLENLFFTKGEGILIDKKILNILKKEQPDREIDNYAIFGYRSDGSANGRTGSYLCIEGDPAEELIARIMERVAQLDIFQKKYHTKNKPINHENIRRQRRC